MKEKRYIMPDDQEPAFASEPAPTVAYHGKSAVVFPDDAVEEREEEEDFDWSKIPFTGGPANEEEAIARIEAIEAENERTGNRLIDIEDFERKLEAKYSWLA